MLFEKVLKTPRLYMDFLEFLAWARQATENNWYGGYIRLLDLL
jgi:hypothetical protein